MQQVSLNLIAIAIFLMTVSVLLGPLVHLSPAIPAAATLAVLGLATIDTLGLGGRGVTLLLDSVARLSGKYRDRVLHHEAGHFLTAYFLGIPIKSYTLNAWESFRAGNPGVGGVVVDTEQLRKSVPPQEIRLFVDRFSTVWMAGIAAEELLYETVEGGEDDRKKVTDTLLFFGQERSQSQLKQQWGKLQAKALIEKHREAYDALVEAMRKRADIADCYQAIQERAAEN
ncbi:ATP-dependent Zn protease [Oscillatoria sp. FACHB-1406]|uniref:ATP-dependent Zn protease n=1 Tax=Oscillatoria sp. FACHB-1406 TaxID=2692846 RepID=UPI001683AF65|nr:ATP-dependent Zn protease [Oscillatoria sp. FACHB-1406]MBD2577042.1 ATP-dependent Zn protease [Oscillatoria sp. FACHB-1406]